MSGEKPANIVLLELNETSQQLLEMAAAQLQLPYVKRLVAMHKAATHTDDVYDSDFLEPWAQWVSIHTGVPSSVHGIKHLGDVKGLHQKQIWERLSQGGVTSGIWGVMNGERRDAELCRFFLADPWTFDTAVYPPQLNELTAFAVYIAKNYLQLNPLKMISYGLAYLIALIQNIGAEELIAATGIFLEGVWYFGAKNMVLGAFYEYTSAVAFTRAKRKYSPQFSIVFLNLIAHLQHHYWVNPQELSPQLKYGFKVIDKILMHIMPCLEQGDILLVANGLSQSNSTGDPPWVLYRPVDPASMIQTFGIDCQRVEALMTHDAHVFFKDESARDQAAAALDAGNVGGKKLFLVERDAQDKCKLFYRLLFTDAVASDATVTCNNVTRPFKELFKEVVTRTGKHSQEGFVYQSSAIVADGAANHEICAAICRHFGVEPPDQVQGPSPDKVEMAYQ